MNLTPREREVFDLLVMGMSNTEIAKQIGVAERTVKAHLKFAAFRNGYQSVNRVRLAREHCTENGHPLPAMPDKLSQIARLAIMGLRNREIARRIGTTEHVVRNYMREVFDVTGCWSRLELATRYCIS